MVRPMATKTIDLVHGPGPSQLTDGMHRYWKDDTGRWRWAIDRDNWSDDGLGIPGHGRGATLKAAVQQAHDQMAMRNAVVNEGDHA